jgi:tetratricopeptide (TPR) repeat protein
VLALLANPQRRLRLLLGVAALLALVSATVNGYRWLRRDGATERTGDGARAPAPIRRPVTSAALDLQIQQQWQHTATHPEDTDGRLALARLLFTAGRFQEAEGQLLLLREREPRRAELHYWLSLVQKQSGNLPAALASIATARTLAPRNPMFHEWQGEIYLAQGRSEEAAATFDACLKRQPESYAALLGKARAMEQLYEAKHPIPIPDMVTPVEKAVRLQPHNPRGVIMLARMAFAYLQQFKRAEDLAKQAIRLDPTSAQPHMILVELALNRPAPANRDAAVVHAAEASRLDPERPEPLYLLGRALMRRGDVAGAIAALERSTRVQMMPEAVYQLSLAHARAGNTEKARHYSRLYGTWSQFSEKRKLLLGLLQHRPEDVAIHARLAELYLSAGARVPAANWARKGLQLRPTDARLRKLLAKAVERNSLSADDADRRR